MNERILVAEDEEVLRANLCEVLENAGYSVTGVADGEAALKHVLEEDYLVVVTDVRMPRLDGIRLLQRIAAQRPATCVLLMTAYASVSSAVDALHLGAYDYLIKPVVFEDLLQKIQRLTDRRALMDQVIRLRRDIDSRLGFKGIVGQSPAMQLVFDLINKVAPTPSTVLITGESGTGKELVARAVHAASPLGDGEFLAVNLCAVPADMVEAQLFGHEKGAFTGADRQRDGLLRSARGGTVFLDEIGDLPMSSQVKLLRALESHEVLPVGADRSVPVEFRLIAATNQDLPALVAQKEFRKDLFFRLNVFLIELPPLRERSEDIPALVSHFFDRHAGTLKRNTGRMSDACRDLLLAYDWPGNVRELSNLIERAMILAGEGDIGPEHLPAELRPALPAPTQLRAAVEHFEEEHIARVLRLAGGSREKAAQMLGVDPATLYRRLARFRQR